MRRGARVIAIYQELREAVGERATATELLICAASLVALFDVEEGMPDYEMRVGRTPFEMQELDVAFADGWRMLTREWNWMGLEADDGCGRRHSEMYL